jgi:DNA-binding NarL/FixJ family response regulator
MTVRVLIADDDTLIRTGLRLILESQRDLEVVGEAADGEVAVAQSRVLRPDVVLMDVRMPRVDGVEATRRITARGDAPRVVVLTTFDLDEHAFAALRAGASGFLLKDARPDDLLAAIRTVHAGDAVIAPSTTRRLLDRVARDLPDRAPGPDPLAVLTDRERQVLLEIARGAANPEIAARLHLSENTVKTHVGHILAKLGLRDRVQAVILAYDCGLVRPSSS